MTIVRDGLEALMMADEDGGDILHYGVKGMKWGVRKSRDNSGLSRATSKRKIKKQAREMSDEELRKKVSRLSAERSYTSLMSKRNETVRTSGQKFISDIIKGAAIGVGTKYVSRAMKVGVEVILDSLRNGG